MQDFGALITQLFAGSDGKGPKLAHMPCTADYVSDMPVALATSEPSSTDTVGLET